MTHLELVNETRAASDDPQSMNSVAIVGMAGRFAGAKTLQAFWENLADGVDAISTFTADDLEQQSGISAALLRRSNYVPAKYVLEDAELFDAEFFGYSNAEARLIDPQQRLFLELSYLALEHGGYHAAAYPGSIGVFGCTSAESYLWRNVFANAEMRAQPNLVQKLISNFRDFVATRTSYKLGLTGPSLTIQSACSSSLVAVHTACQSLLNFECDMALAGGVSITTPLKDGYLYVEGGIGSPDGKCRAFSKEAQGCVAGNGGGIVLLKRLADAENDGDTIHAILRGTAINNDGATKAGFTAPSAKGQAEVIARAHAFSGVDPGTIGYMEAHGTGTQLGDPIEIEALTRAFRAGTDAKAICALASVKTNIGHLDAAAGIAGLLKTCLVLRERQIPPSLHFETPNPKIDFASSPFFVNTSLREWKAKPAHPRRAGISSFGMGGTNAHAVVEEAPSRSTAPSSPLSWQVLVLSGRSAAVVQQMRRDLSAHILGNPDLSLTDAAYTLQVGRRTFAHRFAAVVRSCEEAAAALSGELPDQTVDHMERLAERPVTLSFAGAPLQTWAPALYASNTGFRRAVDLLWPEVRKALGTAPNLPPDLLSSALPPQVLEFVTAWSVARSATAFGIRASALRGIRCAAQVMAALADETTLPEQMMRAQELSPGPEAAESEAIVLDVGTCGLWSPAASSQAPWLAVAGLWAQGAALAWSDVHAGHPRHRVPLPAYPFERKRHWIDPDRKGSLPATQESVPVLDATLPATASAAARHPQPPGTTTGPTLQMFEEQLKIMSRQLDLLAEGQVR